MFKKLFQKWKCWKYRNWGDGKSEIYIPNGTRRNTSFKVIRVYSSEDEEKWEEIKRECGE